MSDMKPRGQKPRMALLPLDQLTGAADVLRNGERKYGRGNWREAESNLDTLDEYGSALLRHYADIAANGYLARDADSGLLALDHLIVNALILRFHALRSASPWVQLELPL